MTELNYTVLDNDTSFSDAFFMSLVDMASPNHDKDAAKKYALENWKDLNSHSKKCYDWVFGRESRLAGFATKPRDYWTKTAAAESRLLAIREKWETENNF